VRERFGLDWAAASAVDVDVDVDVNILSCYCYFNHRFLLLSGAQGIATGKRHAALYCNDDDLEAHAIAMGKLTGDLAHGLPYCPEFFTVEFASAIAGD
jgi:hypothetical protein